MSRLLNLLPASYKGVAFFVRGEQIAQLGQKRITHDYPNTRARYQEPQGKVPFEASLDIFFSSDNWQDEYNVFRRAIEDPLPGRLVMPTFGVFENVVAMPTRAESIHTSIGEIPLNVTFSETIERPSPTTADSSEQDVSDQAETTRLNILEAFTSV